MIFTKQNLENKTVSFEIDESQGERDRYSRLLAYVFLESGENFNKKLIESGYAHEYTYNTPYKYQVEFKEAQKRAEEERVGLWNESACLKPEPKAVEPITVTTPIPATPPSSKYTCGSKKKCGEMSTCEEARYFLEICGVRTLDGDKDGTPVNQFVYKYYMKKFLGDINRNFRIVYKSY